MQLQSVQQVKWMRYHANKKREITFEDDNDSKFVYKASFISLNFSSKILLSVVRRMPSKLFQRQKSRQKKFKNHCAKA